MAAHTFHYLCLFERPSDIPLYLARTRRLASVEQRIVLHANNRGSPFPRCTVPAHLYDVMHIQDWRHGGRGDITSETLGSRAHHQLHTTGGWHVRKRADASSTTQRIARHSQVSPSLYPA